MAQIAREWQNSGRVFCTKVQKSRFQWFSIFWFKMGGNGEDVWVGGAVLKMSSFQAERLE